ncbi:MAG: hypothetical protein NTW03_03600 [Verrucomicrobia bacterium]|nr:hypothetical protein [Verrucomicrobiota bacterium]
MQTEAFTHNGFFSHSAKDKPQARPLAQRLRKGGLRRSSDDCGPLAMKIIL